jgi:hypothetical protein
MAIENDQHLQEKVRDCVTPRFYTRRPGRGNPAVHADSREVLIVTPALFTSGATFPTMCGASKLVPGRGFAL